MDTHSFWMYLSAWKPFVYIIGMMGLIRGYIITRGKGVRMLNIKVADAIPPTPVSIRLGNYAPPLRIHTEWAMLTHFKHTNQ